MDDKCSPRGWTLDTLETYISDQLRALKESIAQQDERNKERFSAAKEAVQAALTAADKALSKAEIASERRFEGVNEFRATLADQATMLMPRSEYTAQHNALVDKVSDIATRVSTVETGGRVKSETTSSSISTVVAIVSVIYGILASIGVIAALLLRH